MHAYSNLAITSKTSKLLMKITLVSIIITFAIVTVCGKEAVAILITECTHYH